MRGDRGIQSGLLDGLLKQVANMAGIVGFIFIQKKPPGVFSFHCADDFEEGGADRDNSAFTGLRAEGMFSLDGFGVNVDKLMFEVNVIPFQVKNLLGAATGVEEKFHHESQCGMGNRFTEFMDFFDTKEEESLGGSLLRGQNVGAGIFLYVSPPLSDLEGGM